MATKCPDCVKAQLDGGFRCARHSAMSKARVRRHRARMQYDRDLQLAWQLEYEGYGKGRQMLRDFLKDLREMPALIPGEIPEYLRGLKRDRRGLEDLTAADLPPKRKVIERLAKLKLPKRKKRR
jgi:hypothetical protein